MSNPTVTKAELVEKIEESWISLQAALLQLTEKQMTSILDAQGWTVKDHIIHMAAWERSVVYFLQGKPRYEGLGVEESVYQKGDFDLINDVIYRQNRDVSLEEAFSQLDEVHRQLMIQLEPLTDADINRTYRSYSSDEAGDGEGPPVYALIYGNSSGHYEEHLGWIEEMLGKSA